MICDLCWEGLEDGDHYGLQTIVVEDEGSWIDVPSDEIGTFIHYRCYNKVVEEIRQEQYKEMNNA